MSVTLDLTWTLGDSLESAQIVKDDAGAVIDLAAPVVIKWTVKEEADDDDAFALFQKVNRTAASTAAGTDEIVIVNPTTGSIKLLARKADTFDKDHGCYCHDVELTRAGTEITAGEAGSVAVTADSFDIVGTGTDFTKLHVGDMLILASAIDANKLPVLLREITDATHATVDYDGWTTEAAVSISKAHVGNVKTVFAGKVTLEQDVTR